MILISTVILSLSSLFSQTVLKRPSPTDQNRGSTISTCRCVQQCQIVIFLYHRPEQKQLKQGSFPSVLLAGESLRAGHHHHRHRRFPSSTANRQINHKIPPKVNHRRAASRILRRILQLSLVLPLQLGFFCVLFLPLLNSSALFFFFFFLCFYRFPRGYSLPFPAYIKKKKENPLPQKKRGHFFSSDLYSIKPSKPRKKNSFNHSDNNLSLLLFVSVIFSGTSVPPVPSGCVVMSLARARCCFRVYHHLRCPSSSCLLFLRGLFFLSLSLPLPLSPLLFILHLSFPRFAFPVDPLLIFRFSYA